MRSLFGGGARSSGTREKGAERTARHSSGWKEMLKHLQRRESLRVLDIGPTSSSNINFLTNMGHSIYMSHLVEEASRPEWMKAGADGTLEFDTDAFLEANLAFAGRDFDVVLLWDTVDYLPASLTGPLLHRLYEVMAPDAVMLALFHAKATGVSTATPIDKTFYRYHLSSTETVEQQRAGSYPLQGLYNNRQIETLLKDFSNFRFFLAKDNLREVIATR